MQDHVRDKFWEFKWLKPVTVEAMKHPHLNDHQGSTELKCVLVIICPYHVQRFRAIARVLQSPPLSKE